MDRLSGPGRRLRALVDRVTARVSSHPAVGTVRAVLDAYDNAAGALLASGLAYAGLFALLSAILFVIGVLGFAVRDSERLAAIVGEIGRRVPPLEGLIRTGLSRVSETAAPFSIVGLAGLAWGASRFYAALDLAFARVFDERPVRGFAARTVRGLAAVGMFFGVILVSAVLASVASYVDEFVAEDSVVIGVWKLVTRGLGLVLSFGAVAALLRFVPPHRPAWGALWLPGLVVAAILFGFTSAFVLVQARLVGALELFSGFAVVLTTMIWLSIAFQMLLIAAAWTAVRDRDRAAVSGSAVGPHGRGATDEAARQA